MHVFLWISVSYLPYTCCISLLVFGISGTRITLHFTWIPSHQLSVMPVSECPKFRGKSTGQLGGGGHPLFFSPVVVEGGGWGYDKFFWNEGKTLFWNIFWLFQKIFRPFILFHFLRKIPFCGTKSAEKTFWTEK